MRFEILSHAGLLVENGNTKLICDPWLIGSCYWRSWWNYPPVSKEIIDSLNPDYICLTHIHWDHFHGPSLRLFSRKTPVIVPKGHYAKMRGDLRKMGFTNVVELKHGESISLSNEIKLGIITYFCF